MIYDEIQTEEYSGWTLTRTDPFGFITIKPNKPGFKSSAHYGTFTNFKEAKRRVDAEEAKKLKEDAETKKTSAETKKTSTEKVA